MALLRSLVFLVLGALPALATTSSQIPPKFNIPWGNSAGAAYITYPQPQSSQIGTVNCRASLTDGFPPLTFTSSGAGGCPPFGQDINGILKQITLWNQWNSMGGPVFYDATLSAAIGGYPKGARLTSTVLTGRVWISTADNNTTNPDDTTGAAANWTVPLGLNLPGTPVPLLSTTIPPGYVSANGLTVGNGSSNATGRANNDTYWLFVFLWNNCPSASCAMFNSGGGGVARGGSAQADWNANNAIQTINMNGAGLMGADSQNGTTTSNLVNVPVTTGSRTVPYSILGENLHVLTVGELAQHNHTDSGHTHTYGYPQVCNCGATNVANVNASSFPGNTNTTSTGNANIQNTGSNTPHNTVPRVVITYWVLQQ